MKTRVRASPHPRRRTCREAGLWIALVRSFGRRQEKLNGASADDPSAPAPGFLLSCARSRSRPGHKHSIVNLDFEHRLRPARLGSTLPSTVVLPRDRPHARRELPRRLRSPTRSPGEFIARVAQRYDVSSGCTPRQRGELPLAYLLRSRLRASRVLLNITAHTFYYYAVAPTVAPGFQTHKSQGGYDDTPGRRGKWGCICTRIIISPLHPLIRDIFLSTTRNIIQTWKHLPLAVVQMTRQFSTEFGEVIIKPSQKISSALEMA